MSHFAEYVPLLAAGTWMTIRLAITALSLGLVLGLFGALAKTSPYYGVRLIGSSYSTLVRGVPELLWIILIFYGSAPLVQSIGVAFGRDDLELSSFWAGSIALAICFGAYATEVFRGSLLAIPKGQREAGYVLGLKKSRIFLTIVLPQMWRIALPGLGNLFMILMKDTALVSAIGLSEIMRSAQIAILTTKDYFGFYAIAALIYLSLTVIFFPMQHALEKYANRALVR